MCNAGLRLFKEGKDRGSRGKVGCVSFLPSTLADQELNTFILSAVGRSSCNNGCGGGGWYFRSNFPDTYVSWCLKIRVNLPDII